MKKAIILFTTLTLLFNSCSKTETNLNPRSGVNQAQLTNKWWTIADSLEHWNFNPNGTYIYVKGNANGSNSIFNPSTFNPSVDTIYFTGSWYWMTNDTCYISMYGTQGKCLVTNLTSDTLSMIINADALTGSSWARTLIKR